MRLLLLNTLYTYIYCGCTGYPSPYCKTNEKPYIFKKVSIISNEFWYPPEPPFVLHLFPSDAACSPNVTFSTVSALARQECFIFPMNFNDSCLSQISLILHRCSRAMNSMVLRTSRFCMAHNVSYFQYILNNLLFAHVRCFKMLLLACVLATFSKFIKTREHQKHALFL